jgi:hypothetical protein
VLGVVLGMTSCGDDSIFQGELYKKVVALVSDDEHNVFEEVHELNGEETVGYVAASCGGTDATAGDIVIEMREDTEAYDSYNRALFDADREKYAQLLPRSMYDIDDYSITIPAGERSGRMKIRVRPEGLSPDSTYLISLKAVFLSAYELNPAKNTILYQVLIKNRYASQKPLSNYASRGIRTDTVSVEYSTVKDVHPMNRNTVRVLVGIKEEVDFGLAAILLEVGADNRVNIRPYGTVTVTQIDGDADYPNIYTVEDDGFKKYHKFLLHYRYRINSGDLEETMKEELRMEIKE